MVKIGKCALIALMHKKWTLRVELTKKKLATVRVGKTPTKKKKERERERERERKIASERADNREQ